VAERAPQEWLHDIVVWGEKLARHIEGQTLESFLADEKTQGPVSRCIEVIGEASRRLMEASPGIETRHPQLELRKAYTARNVLAHGYLIVDMETVWVAATRSIPAMVVEARAVLARGEV
jgi:uncharacterized protein with HEPN domain